VKKYRIDLYIIDKKIAIECDEFNHHNRNSILETTRQKEIEDELHCKFIRFNPDDPNFKLSKLVSDIIKEVI
jgi:very-short-patch-repair endonuclease